MGALMSGFPSAMAQFPGGDIQAVPHMGPCAAFALPGARKAALQTLDTASRLQSALQVMKETRAVLAAKAAISSLELHAC
jgi:hypothetical protein